MLTFWGNSRIITCWLDFLNTFYFEWHIASEITPISKSSSSFFVIPAYYSPFFATNRNAAQFSVISYNNSYKLVIKQYQYLWYSSINSNGLTIHGDSFKIFNGPHLLYIIFPEIWLAIAPFIFKIHISDRIAYHFTYRIVYVIKNDVSLHRKYGNIYTKSLLDANKTSLPRKSTQQSYLHTRVITNCALQKI